MEYFELGDLEKFITPELTENDAKVIGRQLLEGLQFLHSHHLAHRDLKPANIFVARCGPDWWIKLGDFGLARHICTEQNSQLSRIGTLDYMAPEILLENNNGEQNLPYTLAVDIWSLGCVLFRLLTQQLPFLQGRHLQLYWHLKKQFPTDILIKHGVSEDGVSLLSEMMKPNPADRMTLTRALLHSWVSPQKSTSSPGDLDSLTENKLDDKSTNEGSITESRNSIPVNVSITNLEDSQLYLNAASTSHAGTRNISYETPQLSLYDNGLEGLQNEEEVRLRTPLPDGGKLIIDSTDKDADTLERRSYFTDSHLKMDLHRKTMQPFQQTHETGRRLLDDEHPDRLSVMTSLAQPFTELGQDREALQLSK